MHSSQYAYGASCEGTRSRCQESSSPLPCLWSDVGHRLKQRLSKYCGNEIVEEQEQMRPHADRAPAFAVERNDCFGCYLPGVSYICHPGFIVAAVFSPRGVSNANSTSGMN